MANFETDAEIVEWIAKHNEDEFRQNVERHTFGDRRLENARAYLDRIDSERAEMRQEQALLATEQAAGVAQDEAETARQALRISKWALGIALISAFVAVAGLVGK
jgi:multidrug efflux pump subunit AcrA (membrane-fusion protein)